MAENATMLAKYVKPKRSMRKLEAEIDTLNELIYSQIEEAGGKLEGPDYVISSRQRMNYLFSKTHEQQQEEIGRLRKQLKQLESQEISEGVAEVESTTHIVTVRFK